MTCDNCVQHVTKAIRELAGVSGVQVSLAAQQRTRRRRPPSAKAVIAAIEEEGYEAALRS